MAKKKDASAATHGSEYMVLARRYRPQQFADLIGQEPTARALMNAIQSGRVAHAYLFTGARGVGKTSTARILAKALNCVHGPTPTPCDQCDICKAIAEGQDLDVLEIDGASNRGIEDARSIRSNVASRPQRARYKIFIIDEVHMLTREAFNALLKTLEEPPPHVKFIFATTEVQKIPITILSRCQRFDFAGINAARILEQLKRIVAREGMTADDEALRILARRAGGSMRDAQSLLEQVLAFGGPSLTAEAVHGVLGTATDDRVVALASAVLQRDAAGALNLVARCADEGLQLGELLDQLIEYWRALMLLNCSRGTIGDADFSEAHRPTLRQQAEGLNLDTILAGLDILTTAKTRLRSSGHAQVLIEMALVRLARLDELVPLAQWAEWLSQKESGNPKERGIPTDRRSDRPGPGREAASRQNSPADTSGRVPVSRENSPRENSGRLMGPSPTSPSSEASGEAPKKNDLLTDGGLPKSDRNGQANAPNGAVSSLDLNDATLEEIWNNVLARCGVMLAAHLGRAGLPAIIGPKLLALRFPGQYNHAYEYCRDQAQVQAVERRLAELTGQEWLLRLELLPVSETAASSL
ncbi:MAG: DNA polymerase III subunit gamma/tau, partial [Gemmataceae bacterium]|nr:DNA polymerase III subunit gamma/tau [Gemmataceae bacterium]